ncbi:MAG: plasmid recombination protein [Phascolarctobacterium sp.]|nr:plasmid recombination protein [Phascolarctobacterium sp.]
MPNYACINIKPYRTKQSLSAVQREATRAVDYPNVDKERSCNNRQLCGNMDFTEAINNALKSEYYTKPDKWGRYHKPPDVLALGVVLQYSHEAHIEEDPELFQRWIDKNMEFLKARFPGCDMHLVLHDDETTPHIQGLIVMNTPSGKISKNHFIKGKKDMYKLQDDYAAAMAEFGLVRGEHKDRKSQEQEKEIAYYRKLKDKNEKLNIKAEKLERRIETMQQQGNEEYKKRITELKALKREIETLEGIIAQKRREYATLEGETFGELLREDREEYEIEPVISR